MPGAVELVGVLVLPDSILADISLGLMSVSTLRGGVGGAEVELVMLSPVDHRFNPSS